MVKRFIRRQEQGKQLPKGLPITDDMLDRKMKKLGKAIKPGKDEVNTNARARSAVLRVAERLNVESYFVGHVGDVRFIASVSKSSTSSLTAAMATAGCHESAVAA